MESQFENTTTKVLFFVFLTLAVIGLLFTAYNVLTVGIPQNINTNIFN